MARQQTAVRRYAEAAFEIARSDKALDAWERDLATLRDLVAHREVRALVQHPAIPYATKERIMERLAGKDVAVGPLRLVLLMIRRGRPRAIASMVDHFAALLRRERGISLAQVRSAFPLEAAQRTAVTARLREITGTQIELTEQVDPALIGGIAVRIGDQLYDASVRSRLERLRARLTAV
jgi:F-type H+-transporting ATPase subunit delta